jgi:FeS assembly SUF system protein
MGLFSFLSGSKQPAGDGSTDDGRPSGGDWHQAGHGGAAAVATPEPEPAVSAGSVAASGAPAAGSPFVPPAAWDTSADVGLNTGALTAPLPTTGSAQPAVGPPDPALTAELQGPIIEVIKTVYDPEIPVDIYELGLIYDIVVDADRKALVRMTLTSPACPSAQQIPSEVRYKVKAVEGVSDAAVEIVWEPPWDKDRMSEAAKLQLGFF